jgi:beta-glucanase (GH16 family)
MMDILTRISLALTLIIIFINCSESSEIKGTVKFREEFTDKKLSIFRWGAPTFTLYNFKADPSMIENINGINYLYLGESNSTTYPTGFIYTKDHFSYGSYSARMKVSGVPGAVASFFTCSEIAKIFSDGTHDEIDFEFITAKPHAVLFTTWYLATGMEGSQQSPTHNSYLWEDTSFDIREWHIYRFDWYPDRVEFYIDGIRRWTSTAAIPKRDMQIALHIYTIDTWEEVQFPPKGEVIQMTDWVEYRRFNIQDSKFKNTDVTLNTKNEKMEAMQ